MIEAVEAALAAVPENYYVLEPDGRPLPQTSNPQTIAVVLRLCGIREGAYVLEVGTGSGFSTALLSHLVGPTGRVVSVDVDASVARRAKHLLSQQAVGNVVVVAGDGRFGCSIHAPFDLVICWATAAAIPRDWVSQLRLDGVIVAPVSLGPLAHAIAVVRLRRDGEHSVIGERIVPGSFIPLSEKPQTDFGTAPPDADILLDSKSDPATRLSSQWLRGNVSERVRSKLREYCLALAPVSGTGILGPGESVEDFRAYLFATPAAGLTTAFSHPTGRAIGYSTEEGLVLLSLKDSLLFAAGGESADRSVFEWIADWRSLGCPGYDRLEPISKLGPNGWIVRARLRSS